MNSIRTFLISPGSRAGRRREAVYEFEGKKEYDVQIMDPEEVLGTPMDVWSVVRYILLNRVDNDEELILICQDDHHFITGYSKEILFSCIDIAKDSGADMLLGSIGRIRSFFPVSGQVYWTENLSDIRFMILFRGCFTRIVEGFPVSDATVDPQWGPVVENVLFAYPFISEKREERQGEMTGLGAETVQFLRTVSQFYDEHRVGFEGEGVDRPEQEEILLPTYIINLPERAERRKHIREQFAGRGEFDVTFVEACKHRIGAVGLWLSIRRVIELAMKNEDEVILLCEDDHEFTRDYSRDLFIDNIRQAHEQGADYLLGGAGNFGHAIPITSNRYWLTPCLSTQFVVIFRKFFDKILEVPFDDTVQADIQLSDMTNDKMVLFPFISVQRDFGYSDVTAVHNDVKGLCTNLFGRSMQRLAKIQKAYDKYVTNFHRGHPG